MKYTITRIDDDPIENVEVRHGDRLRAEREMNARGFGAPKDNSLTWLTLVTWRAAKRAGHDLPDDFDTFVDTVDDIVQAEDTDAAPFPEAPSIAD